VGIVEQAEFAERCEGRKFRANPQAGPGLDVGNDSLETRHADELQIGIGPGYLPQKLAVEFPELGVRVKNDRFVVVGTEQNPFPLHPLRKRVANRVKEDESDALKFRQHNILRQPGGHPARPSPLDREMDSAGTNLPVETSAMNVDEPKFELAQPPADVWGDGLS